jgi:hypothetical protein
MLLHSYLCDAWFCSNQNGIKKSIENEIQIALQNGKGILLYSLPLTGFRPAGPTSRASSLFPLLGPVAMTACSLPPCFSFCWPRAVRHGPTHAKL